MGVPARSGRATLVAVAAAACSSPVRSGDLLYDLAWGSDVGVAICGRSRVATCFSSRRMLRGSRAVRPRVSAKWRRDWGRSFATGGARPTGGARLTPSGCGDRGCPRRASTDRMGSVCGRRPRPRRGWVHPRGGWGEGDAGGSGVAGGWGGRVATGGCLAVVCTGWRWVSSPTRLPRGGDVGRLAASPSWWCWRAPRGTWARRWRSVPASSAVWRVHPLLRGRASIKKL